MHSGSRKRYRRPLSNENPNGELALLLDMDGTLVDTERTWALAISQTLNNCGVQLSPDKVGQIVHGKTNASAYLALEEKVGKLPDKFESDVTERFKEIGIAPTPGAKDMISAARNAGHRLAVVSNATTEAIAYCLTEADLKYCFEETFGLEHHVDRFGQNRPKPDPFAYENAIRKLGMDPRDCVVFEDSATGLEAALGARIDGGCMGTVVYVGQSLPSRYWDIAISQGTDLHQVGTLEQIALAELEDGYIKVLPEPVDAITL